MKRSFQFRYILVAALIMIGSDLVAQRKSSDDLVFVDDKGVMRWNKSKTEVQGFGVNYTVPFAHAYRSAKKLNVSMKDAIDNDVYHFARLGFDAYRVHVWDTEISDTVGNLLTNEHLELFDYMLNKMKARGMKMILTPIAFWGNGYPDPDEKTPGFSRKYGKGECLTNEDAIKAQENYLFQFFNHVNPNTGVAYKDDPDILAFEISNEPHHNQSADKVTAYINRMVASIRKTGCKKPIFYNISHSIHLVDAYFNANINGGTFQWYPTGLGAQEELGGNLLPNVDRYRIPFADNPRFKKMAKIVYEFDAADVGRSYIYPAMARSFRQAGIQWATHFAYDPTYLAYANTEYNTHYMNLVYAPQKALSLKIASEVFHKVPMYSDYGKYPSNSKFDAFRVSYEEDLAEMLTPTKFIYTNNTATSVVSDKLEEISGFGNSQVVTYGGKGAYFLDKIESGVWRLEVMPDAIWVHDPFGRNNLNKEVAVVKWNTWPMSIDLGDLGKDFTILAINNNNRYDAQVSGNSFVIAPGTYLLARKGLTPKIKPDSKWKNITLNEFSAPGSTVKTTYVLHEPLKTVNASNSVNIEATIVSPDELESVEVSVFAGFRPKIFKMQHTSGYQYAATIPADAVVEGFLRYSINVKEKGTTTTYPLKCNDGTSPELYTISVIAPSSPVYLFDAMSDNDRLSRPWNRGLSFVPVADPGKAEVRVNIEKLFSVDPENPNGESIHDYSMRYCFLSDVRSRSKELSSKNEIILRGRSLNNKPALVQVALITSKGEAYGGLIKLEPSSGDYRLAVKDLKQVKLVTLPRPYPTFLNYFFESTLTGSLDMNAIESLQISIGPGISGDSLNESHGFAVESIRLE